MIDKPLNEAMRQSLLVGEWGIALGNALTIAGDRVCAPAEDGEAPGFERLLPLRFAGRDEKRCARILVPISVILA